MTTVAVIGAGALGAAMATRLAEGGFDVCLWNRTAARAEEVAAESGTVVAARTVAVAVADADVVLTVLRDGPAVAAVAEEMLSGHELRRHLGPGKHGRAGRRT